MHYIKRKSSKAGNCAICGKHSALTWDHIPPSAGITLKAVEIRQVMEKFTGRPSAGDYRISQNGVKVRSLCSNCNNAVLGGQYDLALTDLVRATTRFLSSSLRLPPVVHVEVKPHGLMRAVLGHLLAAKLTFDESEFDALARHVVLNKDEDIPRDINVSYWLYPYDETVLIRDILMPARRGDFSDFAFTQLIKFYPIGFMVTDTNSYGGLPNLNSFKAAKPTDKVQIPIPLAPVYPTGWPEKVDNGNIVFGGNSLMESIYSKPR